MTTARSFGRGLEFDRAADSHPLLWSAFTLLAFDELERHINLQQLTTFADDYIASWDISSALQLNNACVQAGKLIDTLTDLGMQIAADKSVILLAIGARKPLRLRSGSSLGAGRAKHCAFSRNAACCKYRSAGSTPT